MKCKNCKFWNRGNIIAEGTISFNTDMGGMAYCLNEKLDSALDAKIISSEDAPTSEFITSPNFGCIHFDKYEG